MIEIIPPTERPRERCLTIGADCLSLRECLALILGSGPPGKGCMGLASGILERIGPGIHPTEVERAFFTSMEISGFNSLKEIAGLGPAGQARILAAFELGRRYSAFRNQSLRKLQKKRHLLPELADGALEKVSHRNRSEPQEWLGFVPVHRSGDLGELCIVEKGARTHVNTDPGELFARILVFRPRGFFLFHNHPSGQMTPSIQDLDLTEKVREIALQLGIQLLGHWIVSSQSDYWIHPAVRKN